MLSLIHDNRSDLLTISDYIYSFGNAKDALLYSSLFMPELIVVEDSVLIKDNYDLPELKKRFLTALQKTKNKKADISIVESSFNFIEVGYIFEPHGRNTLDKEDEILAYRIRDAWRGWLSIQYPSRKFIVEVLSSEQTGSSIGVSFFQQR